MATTTNYGWTTPDDTALVKDGAAAIRTLGSSVDTTTKNLNPETTLGDMSFRSSTSNVNTRIPIGSSGQHLTVVAGVPAWATPSDQTPLTTKGDLFTFSTLDARLGVGANNTVLTADSAEATGLKWAAPSSGLTLISRTTFSASAAVTIDSLFSNTYENYLVKIQASVATGPASLQLQFRYGSTTHTGANYDYAFGGVDGTANTFRFIRNYGQTSILLEEMNTTPVSLMDLNVCRLNGSAKIQLTGTLWGQENIRGMAGGAFCGSAQTWSGIILTPTSSTITGQVTVYGLAKS